MPIVTLPKMVAERAINSSEWLEVRVSSRRDVDIYRELALLFSSICHLLVGDGGQPRWTFALHRDSDHTDLRYLPDDHVLDPDERLSLIPMVGC